MIPIANRFFRYVSIDTQGNAQENVCPSSENQRFLAELLMDELQEFGVEEVMIDEKSFLYARIPSNVEREVPSLAFIAHLDTSPEVPGGNVKPRIVEKYDGGSILLNKRLGVILSPEEFPAMLEHKGEDLIVTDGTTVLGADGKAGITEIMEAIKHLSEHPEIEHGEIYIVFTPDEELGYSTDFISMERVPARFGFTVEGGSVGEINYENFNAATATVRVNGSNIHPGAARNKMKNAVLLAQKFISCIPENETPESTENYEGYYHISDIRGGIEKCIMTYNIRDFNPENYSFRKERIKKTAEFLNEYYGKGTFEVQVEDYYLNMKQKVDAYPELMENAEKAIRLAGIEPKCIPVRGGTDGVTISFMGMPCPNIFSGEQNGQSVYEFISVQTMEKATQVIVNLIRIFAEAS
ncbi:peptidase T [Bariatricus massiliensis]|uniref:Peptidase T n=1 Tax=Bariatricus massiliensis TaxID=1745713 RepID=A0ABS8DE36_9FIRM|nr:peptidase T [Bariatricus massiliensis]MCB7302796.1 peptidase T [Bariatricus massiliensis]MCB7374012.1 peptidase T [Bariatricus massiliensis]MCB7386682.1 peptidase T [Bariatricus massiliensis]MCB7410844.1 peptidase T [Bariatricus massiliensis]MCQ5251668.1 peptidase T [Bariatricus massiliensis]